MWNGPAREYPYLMDDRHAALGDRVDAAVLGPLAAVDSGAAVLDEDAQARLWLAALAREGLLASVVPQTYGGARRDVDIRSVCLVRERLARLSGLSDTMFAMQGLGSYPITLAGTDAQRERYLPGAGDGSLVMGFALTEAEAGSDVGAMTTTARPVDGGWVLDGRKVFISNAGIADVYTLFARIPGEGADAGISAFVVHATDAGLSVPERLHVTAPHPIGVVQLDGCRLPADRLLGEPGRGMRVALGTLDRFRPTVGAAAIGLGLRAVEEALRHASGRVQFGKPLLEHQAVGSAIAQAWADLEAARQLVYQAAWRADHSAKRIALEASAAKLLATEAAFRAADMAVQVHGGRGVLVGGVPERLYREVRALRIYEGTSEIQKLVIARHLRQAFEASGGVVKGAANR